MIHDIPKPDISPNFTIEDIHKIREWNYERTKDASFVEYKSLIKKESDDFLQFMAELKASTNTPRTTRDFAASPDPAVTPAEF